MMSLRMGVLVDALSHLSMKLIQLSFISSTRKAFIQNGQQAE